MTHKTNARLAGFMFLFYIASTLASMAIFAPATRGETAAAKLASIAAHPSLMRASIATSVLMILNALLLGLALWALTRDYDRDLALLALLCRFAEGLVAPISAFIEGALLFVATTDKLDATLKNALGSVLFAMQPYSFLVSATVFAIGSTIFCWIFLRARTIPRWLAWLGLVGSALLVVGLPLQTAGILTRPLTMYIWIPVAAFEVIFGVWLLVKGAIAPPMTVAEAAA
jgi:Domain of unknown function (DUF4386)